MDFQLASNFQPTGDQPAAIDTLSQGIERGKNHQVLLGVTGSGKTFTVANVIQKVQKPTLVIAHNKTLAAQLYQEFRDFFPNNAVSYFVSYYDYYQPEAYIPTTDTYIEKDSSINDDIDKLRLAATTNLMTRKDVIIVASVSCIYNLGSPVEYGRYMLQLIEGEIISRETLLLQLANLQYERSNVDLERGTYRLRGDTIQVWPAYEDRALKIDTLENRIVSINWIDPVSGVVLPTVVNPNLKYAPAEEQHESKMFVLYPAKHYVVNPITKEEALANIRKDLQIRLQEFKDQGKILEAYRLEQKVNYDLEMISNLGFTNGIENYSRYFDGRKPGDAPYTLLDYFHENSKQFDTGGFLTVIDESHITLPQVRGMYNGDQARKQTLVEYGFRLPSAMDNRPLQFHEFLAGNNQFIHVSATPNDWEVTQAGEVVEQLIRPTGLIDPEVELRPSKGQIEDLVIEIIQRQQRNQRTLVTTLTKKMAEALTDYLNDKLKIDKLIESYQEKSRERHAEENPEKVIRANEQLPIEQMAIGPIDEQYFSYAQVSADDERLTAANKYPKVAYLHSDIDTLERSDILDDLRRGVYDVVIGINLLREGLDLPEVTLVAILDADKEGFLRSRTSLIQTMGRAARHSQGHVIMYADRLTGSMQAAISETQRRRAIQMAYNQQHGITPTTIEKTIRERMIEKSDKDQKGRKKRGSELKTELQLNKETSIILEDIQADQLTPYDRKRLASQLRRRMKQAANEMDFELAAAIRDKVTDLEPV